MTKAAAHGVVGAVRRQRADLIERRVAIEDRRDAITDRQLASRERRRSIARSPPPPAASRFRLVDLRQLFEHVVCDCARTVRCPCPTCFVVLTTCQIYVSRREGTRGQAPRSGVAGPAVDREIGPGDMPRRPRSPRKATTLDRCHSGDGIPLRQIRHRVVERPTLRLRPRDSPWPSRAARRITIARTSSVPIMPGLTRLAVTP